MIKPMSGIINVYKERGFTSHDVVAKLRGILHTKKIGHTGTLDPEATGVLPVCVGKATKVCGLLTDKDKTYVAEVKLGVVTDTQDMTGEIQKECPVPVTEEELREVVSHFAGEISQIPPMYSAIKVNGKKLYNEANTNYNKLKNDLENNNVSKKNLADSKEKLIRLEQDLKTFEPYKDKEDFVICSMINGLANDMMWTMYIGNNKLGEYLFAVNRVYYETIKYCFENHYRFLDLYGTSGDPNTTYKNLGGLHKYKERFGDTYIEFIGEFDLVNKKVLYKVLPILLKIYRKSYKLIKKH